MGTETCSVPGCNNEVVIHLYRVRNRRLYQQATYCEEHAHSFLADYFTELLAGEGAPSRCQDAVAFDVDLLLLDERPNKPCQFSLREVGGTRRLDCGTGIFEVSALQRELERLSMPRPLTHRAMASLVTALGGRLDRVLVDKFLASQRIYEAKLHIHQATSTVVVDVRISDAVVLAVICEVPIFVSDQVLAGLSQTPG